MGMFRKLTADEVECRVATINDKGLSLLLYKDARCDMNILDETVGPMNWQKHYSRDNANCTVAIYDSSKNQWIEKEDTGTQSNTEAEKGLASDSFKRACFNWGIGRELYTAPFIWITPDGYTKSERNGKPTTYDRFDVKSIGYDEAGRINALEIVNSKAHKTVFSMGGGVPIEEQRIGLVRAKALAKELKTRGIKEETIFKLYKVNALAELKEKQMSNIASNFDKILESQEGEA